MLWWLSCVGVYGSGRLIVVICMVRQCVSIIGVHGKIWGLKWMWLGRSICVGFMSWLE